MLTLVHTLILLKPKCNDAINIAYVQQPIGRQADGEMS